MLITGRHLAQCITGKLKGVHLQRIFLSSRQYKVLFFGTDDFSLAGLKALHRLR